MSTQAPIPTRTGIPSETDCHRHHATPAPRRCQNTALQRDLHACVSRDPARSPLQEPELLQVDNSAQIFNTLSDVPGDVQDVDELMRVRPAVTPPHPPLDSHHGQGHSPQGLSHALGRALW